MLQSRLRLDSIMGLPFFVPAFMPGNRLVIYGGHRELEHALRAAGRPSFQVDFSIFGAIQFVEDQPGIAYDIAGPGSAMRRRHARGTPRLSLRGWRQGAGVLHQLEHPLGDTRTAWTFICNYRGADLVR
ncbi:MAG: hypothetical protein U5L03_04160 [Burkholderiaceae bacterium]|nr:hypothetical protein [Burkholderiaceae bacterium]